MNEALQVLLADGVIDGVVGRLKSGKEAEVYLVSHQGEVVAAKVYKERDRRNFRNNVDYREGRQVRNSRTARAIARGSRFGLQAAEDAWKSAESDALFKLHAAGVCVPKPVVFYEGVLLMELVVDLEGQPAPRLEEASLTAEEASALYFDLRNQVIRMLCCDIIHGDLSPFNILLGNRGATLIDLPQVVDAAANSRAEFFFTRDLENLRRYFESSDPSLRARAGDAYEIWRAYQRRELTPEFEPTGRVQPPRQERRFGGGPPRGGEGRPGGGPGGPRFGDGRPPGDRPRGERFQQGGRPPGDRPQGERFPRGDRPQGDRPQGERFPRGDRPQGERFQQGGRPQGERPPGERFPRGDRPRGERPPQRERFQQGERPPRSEAASPPGRGEQGARPSGPPQGPSRQPRREGAGNRGPRQVSYKAPPKKEEES